jgi:hypothetical protein
MILEGQPTETMKKVIFMFNIRSSDLLMCGSAGNLQNVVVVSAHFLRWTVVITFNNYNDLNYISFLDI